MSNSSSRRESMVDAQIRLAQERGEFDNLPGTGKPLPRRHAPDDELWWIKDFVSREEVPTEALLPTSLRLAREAERLPERVRRLPSEQAVRAAVGELNRKIADYLRMPSGPYVPVRRIDPDEIVRNWYAARQPAAGPAAPAAPPTPIRPRRRRPWWPWGRARP